MRKHIFFIFIFILISQYSESQNVDSLKNVYKTTHNIEDKTDACLKLNNYYFYSNPDTALYYMHEGLKLSKKNNFKKKEIYFLTNLGIFYNEEGSLIKAKQTFIKALNLANEIKDTLQIISIYGNLGNNSMLRGDFDKAFEHLSKTVEMYEKLGNIKGIAYSYGAIGNMYNQMGKDMKAIDYYELSKAKFEIIHDTMHIALIMLNNGIIYADIKKYDTAEKYLNKAYKIFTKNNIKLNAGKCLQELSNLYLKTNKLSLSIKYANEALKIFNEINSKIDISGTYQTLGIIYLKQNKNKKAILYLKKAYSIDSIENNYLNLQGITNDLKKAYTNIHDYKNALKFANQYISFHDSVYNTKTSDKFSELEIKYETNKKEQKIVILEKNEQILEAKQQRNFWVITGLIILFVLASVIYILVYNRQKLKAKQKTIEIEQKILRLQMNPHFIFNAIFAIQSFMLDNDTEKSSMYLSNFAKLMRLILENSRKNQITLDEEIKMLEYYIQFQQLKNENSFEFKIEVSQNIDSENTLIPPMLVQPFVENAVKHGFSEKKENAFLKISFNLKNNYIFVSIQDNGKGFNKTKDKKTNHHSLATQITKERLSLLLNKKDNKNIELRIVDLQEIDKSKIGTKVSFKIPFVEEF